MAAEDEAKRYSDLIAKTWADPDFKAGLLQDPAGTLRAEGWEISDRTQVDVIEPGEDHVALVIPAKPSELSDEQLDSVAGGFSVSTSAPPSVIGTCTTCYKL